MSRGQQDDGKGGFGFYRPRQSAPEPKTWRASEKPSGELQTFTVRKGKLKVAFIEADSAEQSLEFLNNNVDQIFKDFEDSPPGHEIPTEVKQALIESMKQEPSTIRHLAKKVDTDSFQLTAKANAIIQQDKPKGDKAHPDSFNAAMKRYRSGDATDLDREIIRIYNAKEQTSDNRNERGTLKDTLIQNWPEIKVAYQKTKYSKGRFPEWLHGYLREHHPDALIDPTKKKNGACITAAAIKKKLQRLKLPTP